MQTTRKVYETTCKPMTRAYIYIYTEHGCCTLPYVPLPDAMSFHIHEQCNSPPGDSRCATFESMGFGKFDRRVAGEQYASPLDNANNAGTPHGKNTDNAPRCVSTDSWKSSFTIDKDLTKVDGKLVSYKLWSSRLESHLICGCQPWGRLLQCTERNNTPLTSTWLSQCPSVDGVKLDHVWISRQLWTVLGPQR